MFRSSAQAARPMLRYASAISGPIGSAGAQFLLSLVLLRSLGPGAFGRFTFLLILSQFSWGVWTALFCAPLPILLAEHRGDERRALVRCLMLGSLVGAIVAFGLFLVIGLALGAGPLAAALFAGYAALALVRWFARAHAYAFGHPLRTTASDLAYAAVVLVCPLVLLRHGGDGLELASGTLFAGAAVGLLPFGRHYLHDQFLRWAPADLSIYPTIWRRHAGWSLLGVLTTEATANAHAYLVTLISGPVAFAPVAASALLLRPITVASNALTEFERAQMARQIGEGRIDRVRRAVRFFRLALGAAWLATALAAALLLTRAPQLVFPRQYDLGFLVTGTILWMLVGGVRAARTPESALLQAAGAFRPLAMASVRSCGVSVAAVLVLLLWAGPLWSVLGILLGEAAFAAEIWRQARRWLAGRGVTRPSAMLLSSEEDPVLAGEAAMLR